MKFGVVLGVVAAIVLHVGFIAFGGLLFASAHPNEASLQEVELLSDTDPEKPTEPVDQDPAEKLETDQEQPPDAEEIIRNLESPVLNNAPALDAASLSAIEAALSGQTSSGDFAQSLDFASGGRIGGTGRAGAMGQDLDEAFSLAEIDQKPRTIFQSQPIYPSEMRGKRLEGVVNVIFVIDPAGKVINPRVEKSTHVAFEKPALDAVRRWKFEPAVKGGQRVACKMRVPIRFQPS